MPFSGDSSDDSDQEDAAGGSGVHLGDHDYDDEEEDEGSSNLAELEAVQSNTASDTGRGEERL